MKYKVHNVSLLHLAALLVGGLTASSPAQASTCATDALSGICDSAQAQPKAATLAQADSCDQFSGVCIPTPSAKTEWAHQAPKAPGHQAGHSDSRVQSESVALWWGAERPRGTF